MTTTSGNETTATDGTMVNEHDEATVNRRGFLKLGGLTAGIAVAAVACVEPRESGQIAQTGTLVTTTPTSKAPFPGSEELDATYALTAVSVEKLTIDTYGRILEKGWLTEPTSNDLVRRLQDHHRQHSDAAAAMATGLGQDAASVQPNNQLKVDLVDDEIAAIEAFGGDTMQAEAQTWRLILGLEDTLQQLYNRAAGTMTTPALRLQIASLGMATSRQFAAAATFANEVSVPFTFVHSAPGLLPVDSYVRADPSKVRRSAPTTTTTAATTAGTTAGSTPGSTPGSARG